MQNQGKGPGCVLAAQAGTLLSRICTRVPPSGAQPLATGLSSPTLLPSSWVVLSQAAHNIMPAFSHQHMSVADTAGQSEKAGALATRAQSMPLLAPGGVRGPPSQAHPVIMHALELTMDVNPSCSSLRSLWNGRLSMSATQSGDKATCPVDSEAGRRQRRG
jgi:hypothetical protein